FGELPAMTIEAAVGLQRQLVAFDGMRNDRRLLRIIAHLADIVDDRAGQRRRRALFHRLRATGDARHDIGGAIRRERPDREHDRAAEDGTGKRQTKRRHTGTILTAHFLKSVCLEIGSVASSVVLLMSWLASNQGTNTTPRGIRLRPRVSTRVLISPRRETSLISAPSLMPRARASSACMKQRAPGNALYSSGTR